MLAGFGGYVFVWVYLLFSKHITLFDRAVNSNMARYLDTNSSKCIMLVGLQGFVAHTLIYSHVTFEGEPEPRAEKVNQ